ncbi:MAG: hypothetical protein LUE29_06315 [Lachnospiraceae bacterium]|nr:hypothetical protein [Lachnospiraceae bacterium]
MVAIEYACHEFHEIVRFNETGKIIWKGIAWGRIEEEFVNILVEKAVQGKKKAVVI